LSSTFYIKQTTGVSSCTTCT